jgi:hypothetical protein
MATTSLSLAHAVPSVLMAEDEDVPQEARLQVLRKDEPRGVPRPMVVNVSDEFEDVRLRAFRTAYPGNDDMPLCVRSFPMRRWTATDGARAGAVVKRGCCN